MLGLPGWRRSRGAVHLFAKSLHIRCRAKPFVRLRSCEQAALGECICEAWMSSQGPEESCHDSSSLRASSRGEHCGECETISCLVAVFIDGELTS